MRYVGGAFPHQRAMHVPLTSEEHLSPEVLNRMNRLDEMIPLALARSREQVADSRELLRQLAMAKRERLRKLWGEHHSA